MCEGGAGGDASGHVECIAFERRGIDQAIVEAPALALRRRHAAAGIEELGGAALADDAGQDRTRAHVAAGEPDAREQERGLGLGRGDADIGGHAMIAPAPTATPSTAVMIGLPQ